MESAKSESLIQDWIEGVITPENEAILEAWLDEDVEHLRRFVEANASDQAFRSAVQTEDFGDEAAWQATPSRPPNGGVMRWAAGIIAVAASVALILWMSTPSGTHGAAAQVVALSGVRINGHDSPPDVGDEIRLTDFRLETGTMTLMLASDVRLQLVAPLEAAFEDDMRVRLIEGCLSANVGKRGKGFTIVTGAGEVVDLGTEFGIEVDRDGESRVAVFSGKVEFHPRETTGTDDFITLTEGEALRFSARGGHERWQQISLAADRAGLTGKPSTGVVRGVHDNLRDGELRRFYGVVRGGMKPGALAFTDKENPVWSAMPGEAFPSWLEGADLIRTYYRVSYFNRFELSVTLGGAAEVFLMVAPNEAPDWLEQQFQRTGVQLRTGPWHRDVAGHPDALTSEDGIYMTFDVWKCDAKKGELKFGPPPNRTTDRMHSTMYGLAVKAMRSE